MLVRADFNVPLKDGAVTDDTRIAPRCRRSATCARGAALILCSHLGRPKDREPELSLRPVAERLTSCSACRAAGADVVGDRGHRAAHGLSPGEVLLLENLRFEPGETKNDPRSPPASPRSARSTSTTRFGAAHRAHASTVGVAQRIGRAGAGRLLERELEDAHRHPGRSAEPLVAILGGAKVSDKIAVIDRFLEVADALLIGGAMCFPFFAAQGHAVGDSLCEDGGHRARAARAGGRGAGPCRLELPTDLVLGDRFEADARAARARRRDVPAGWMGLDVGPRTASASRPRSRRPERSSGTARWASSS